MARRQGGPDPKEAALAEARCLNPHPEQVTDAEFLASDFFDARDAVQVKYEMVRKVKAGGAPVTEAAAAFGYSRPAYYAAAAALESAGLEGLVPARPGPRGGHKLTEEILAWAEEQLAADPGAAPGAAAGPDRGGLRRARAPPLGRASAGPPPGAPLQKPLTCPPARTRKEEHPSLSLRPHLATRLLNRAPARMPARLTAPGGGLDARYEQLRHAALHARARGVPARARRADRQGRHRLAARPGQPGRPARRPAARPAPPRLTRPRSRPRWPPSSSAPWRPSRSPAAAPARPRNRSSLKETPMLPDTAASKVTAAHLSRRALLYVRQSSLKQVIHNTESAIRQYDLRGKAIALGWAAEPDHRDRHRPGPVRRLGRGPGRVPAAGRRGRRWAGPGSCSAWRCSRLARNNADWHQLLGAPRGAVYSCGDGRAPPPGRRSGLVKLEAA